MKSSDDNQMPGRPPPVDPAVGEARANFGWAIEIVRKHFSSGLTSLCDPDFLERRYRDFQRKQDPIYNSLLAGMQDEPLSKTFVSYWTVAQTLATQSRFWLERAVAEIIIHQTKNFGRSATHVYSQSMLSSGYLERAVKVAEIGEDALEHLTDGRPWRPSIQTSALEKADVIVGEQERERVAGRDEFLPRTWQRKCEVEAVEADMQHLAQVAESLKGPPVSEITLNCNLLVVEPDKRDSRPHVHAFRFVNPKTLSSHPSRKQERVNLLRLYALLCQEKIFRDPDRIHVCAAELLPRYSDFDRKDHYPDYFSSHTYWLNGKLWKFIGVPFKVVDLAVADAGVEFRDKLKSGLRKLLPSDEDSKVRLTIREQLEPLIRERGINAVASATGIDSTLIHHWFNPETEQRIGDKQLELLAKALGGRFVLQLTDPVLPSNAKE